MVNRDRKKDKIRQKKNVQKTKGDRENIRTENKMRKVTLQAPPPPNPHTHVFLHHYDICPKRTHTHIHTYRPRYT